MKKFTLVALCVFMISVANAQFSAGDRYLGGSIGFNYNDNDINSTNGSRTIGVNLSPSLMKFKSDKKATGFKISLGYSDHKTQSGSAIQYQKNYNAGLGVFNWRVYSLGKGFFLSLEKGINGSVGWNDAKDNQPTSNKNSSTTYGIGAYLSPGVGYKLTDRLIVGLNLNSIVSVGYNHTSNKTTNSSGVVVNKSESDGVSLTSSLNNTTLGQIGVTFAWKLK